MVKFIKFDVAGKVWYINATAANAVLNTVTGAYLTRVSFKYSSNPNNTIRLSSFSGAYNLYSYILKAYSNAISSSANSPIYDPTITQGTQPTLNTVT
tara:strand:- start:609 stop:899 length:291 start_codon:yes stop_codon:yes gene_type:complete